MFQGNFVMTKAIANLIGNQQVHKEKTADMVKNTSNVEHKGRNTSNLCLFLVFFSVWSAS
jgi:hypothetical protein